MKESTFVIHHLDNGWDWPDIHDNDDAVIYCCEELDVPAELIEEVQCYAGAMKISLTPDRRYYREDWYVNLQRCA